MLPVEMSAIENKDECWVDNLHLSDYGLKFYLQNIEIGFRSLMDGNDASRDMFDIIEAHTYKKFLEACSSYPATDRMI